MPKQRIRGIVREAQRFRRALSAPLTPAEQHELHARLRQRLAEIDALLIRTRTSPARLTGPSRLAYDYLKKMQAVAVQPADAQPRPVLAPLRGTVPDRAIPPVRGTVAGAIPPEASSRSAWHGLPQVPGGGPGRAVAPGNDGGPMPGNAQLLLWPEILPPQHAPEGLPRTQAAGRESLAARTTRQRVRVRPPDSVTLRGLRGFLERLLDRIALSIEAGRLDRVGVQRAISGTCGEVEDTLAARDIGPEHLRAESRELLGWFRYFSRPGNLDHYYVAVDRAQVLWGGVHAGRLRWRMPLLVHVRPSKYLYRWRVLPAGTRIVLNTPMITAPDAVLRALARQMAGGGSDPAVLEHMMSPPYQAVAREIERLAGKVEQTRGLTCDLAEIFEAVNREYFASRLARPKLLWSRNLTGHKFGHYDYVRDTVMISSSLDSPDVPPFVIRHVMHHELLHKKHGFHWRAGRRQSHTPAFRAEERSFPEYDAADQFLRRFGR